MALHIDVPATLANLGSGFDALGLAVSLGNTFHVARGPWSVDGRPLDPADHLVLATAREVAVRVAGREVPFALTVDERVPRARGLGSSATARVAGLLAGLALVDAELPIADQLRFLADAEGHPDNAWPALLGGLVICGELPKKITIAPGWRLALCVPEVEVSTPLARRALPDRVPHVDAVHNLRAVALLVAGLIDGDGDAIRAGVSDRLHQPWRAPLIGPVESCFDGARALGAAPFVGGSGSTLAAFVPPGIDALAVASALAAPFHARGVHAVSHGLDPNERGAVVAGRP
jgi:homoserine kinase